MSQNNWTKQYKNHSQITLLLALTLSIGCAPGKFERHLDDPTLTPNEREDLHSELLSKNFLKTKALTNVTTGEASASSTGAPSASQGNAGGGIVVSPPSPPPIPCQVLNFAVYQDRNNDGIYSPEERLGLLRPFSGTITAKANYRYVSASAHPKIGPAPEGFKTKLFLYADYRGTNLNIFSNIDSDSKTSGSSHNQVSLDITTSGNGGADGVILSDDHLELRELPSIMPLSEGGARPDIYPIDLAKSYQARWQYWYNTDGGIIGPLNGSQSQVKINLLKLGDIKSVELVSASGEVIALSNSGTPTTLILKAEALSNPGAPEDDTVTSSCPQPGEPKLQIKIKPVRSVELITYPSECKGQPSNIVCPAMARANDYLIKGATQPVGSTPVNAQVRFMEQYSSCAETAKKAMNLGKGLTIYGRGSKEPGSSETRSLYFSEISTCQMNK